MALPDRSDGYHLARERADGPLVEEWAGLADRAEAPFELHPGYLAAWADAYSLTGRLVAVTARRDGRLAAVLPLVRSRSRLSAQARRYVGEVGVVADGPESAAAAMTAALSLPVARLVMRPVPEGGATHRALAAAAARTGRPLLERAVETHSLIDLTGDWDEYWGSRSPKMKKDLGKRRRRLEQLGDVRVGPYDPSALDAALDDAFRIEASGWKGRGGSAIADNPAEERFYRALARWADARGWFRLFFLRLDDRPIAFRLGVEAFGVYSSLKIGYLEQYAAYSPGNVLEAAVMEQLGRGDCRRFDYAGETTERMRRWATGSRQMLELSAFPPTLAGRAGWAAAELRVRGLPLAKRARDRVKGLRPRA